MEAEVARKKGESRPLGSSGRRRPQLTQPKRRCLPGRDDQVFAASEASRWRAGIVAEVAPVKAWEAEEVVVVEGAPRARRGRPVAIVREQDGGPYRPRRETGALVVQHQPHVVRAAACVPKRVRALDVAQCSQQQQRPLLRALCRLAGVAALVKGTRAAAVVRGVGVLDDGVHEERREVDGHIVEVRFRGVGRAQGRVEQPLMEGELHRVE
mmetsp:Transcript_12153/g.38693  ORF Transcript_12153/g.38693 Transcript_12153/m.38693 type:complete len:211 (+) Transcript_12153:762-1394(+)